MLAGAGLVLAAAWMRIGPEGTWDEGGLSRDVRLLGGAALLLGGIVLHVVARHRARRDPDLFFSPAEEARVLGAIVEAERRTSGEIRVHLERSVEGEILAEAQRSFEALGMTATALRNGVLFFIDVKGHTLAVLGDTALHACVEESFWRDVVGQIETRFREGDRAGGLIAGIEIVAERLARHFPPIAGDVNELPNTLSRGEEP
jgi:uncharacterized membrane protein